MKNILNVLIVVLTGFLYSCSEDWLDVRPKGESSETSFYSKEGLESLLIGVYSVVDGAIGGGGDERGSDVENWVWGGIVSDDAYKGAILSDKGNEANEIEGFYINSDNPWLAGHWRTLY